LLAYGSHSKPKKPGLPRSIELKQVVRNLDGIAAKLESHDLSRDVIASTRRGGCSPSCVESSSYE
jgi:hypothetical protein